jgi:uncharacterized protein
MGERSQYAPGTFSWVELASTDQEAAKAFYGSLFGWVSDDRPVGDGGYYSMQMLGDKSVAAISSQPAAQREVGVPPLWNSYVSVQSADESAARAAELGGTVHAGPFDVMQAGRMAVIQDPQGAFFMLWESGENFGAALVNAPGALVWNELSTPDMAGAGAFYGGLFGWTTDPMESPEPYWIVKNGQASNGGIRPLEEPTQPNWLVDFGVEDIDRGIARVSELGGGKIVGPVDIGIAKLAVLHDPQGAVFAIYAGQLDA